VKPFEVAWCQIQKGGRLETKPLGYKTCPFGANFGVLWGVCSNPALVAAGCAIRTRILAIFVAGKPLASTSLEPVTVIFFVDRADFSETVTCFKIA
jgi:hypothetical protein